MFQFHTIFFLFFTFLCFLSCILTPANPSLCRLMPAVLQTLTGRKDLRSSDIYLLSAVTALQRVIETLPHFISPYLQDVILQVSEAPVARAAPL